jgi:L-aspartate oxidase
VHGGNRLASNSLLEALVFGRRAAAEIQRRFKSSGNQVLPYDYQIQDGSKILPSGIIDEIKSIMQDAYFVLPNRERIMPGLCRANEIMRELKEEGYKLTYEYCEALSLATMASLILSDVVDNDEK